MRVLGRETSGNVQKVLFLLEELGVAYDREDYGRQFSNTATEEYLTLNPTGKVPTLVDGDVAIWESNTILRYIASTAGPGLYPADPAKRSEIERWMDWLLASVNSSYMTIFKATKAGDDVPDAAIQELAAALTMADKQLGMTKYLAGDTVTLADICLAPILHRCINFPVDLPDLPSLRRWHGNMAERPAFQKVVR